MKTMTKRQAARRFDSVTDLAHCGETVVLTHHGQPWCKLVPVENGSPRIDRVARFQERLNRIGKPAHGVVQLILESRR